MRVVYTINKDYTNDSLQLMQNKKINMFRINLSRTDANMCGRLVSDIRCIYGAQAYIIVDLPGKKIRTRKCCKTLYEKGKMVDVYLQISENVKLYHLGDVVRIGDDGLVVEVTDFIDGGIHGIALEDGCVTSYNGIEFINREIDNTHLLEGDIFLLNQIKDLQINAISISFAESVEVIDEAKRILDNPQIEVVAKIESLKGIHIYEQMLAVADGIMVGRGDLSKNIGMAETNAFITQLESVWNYPKKLFLATHYFYDYLKYGKTVDSSLYSQDRDFVTGFVADESSYFDWREIAKIKKEGELESE